MKMVLNRVRLENFGYGSGRVKWSVKNFGSGTGRVICLFTSGRVKFGSGNNFYTKKAIFETLFTL